MLLGPWGPRTVLNEAENKNPKIKSLQVLQISSSYNF